MKDFELRGSVLTMLLRMAVSEEVKDVAMVAWAIDRANHRARVREEFQAVERRPPWWLPPSRRLARRT